MAQKQESKTRDIADQLGRMVSGKIDKQSVREFAGSLRHSTKLSRKTGVTISGQGIAELLLAVAPRIPVRDVEALSKAHGGTTGTTLAGQVIRSASRASAGVGAATGAVASANQLAPPLWVMLPAELVGETLLIAAIEMRMVAELHAVYGMAIEGEQRERGIAILSAWAERRGVAVEELKDSKKLSQALGKGTSNQLVALVKRKLMARLFRNVSTLAPLLVGAVAAGELNRRATRDLGNDLVKDLSAKTK